MGKDSLIKSTTEKTELSKKAAPAKKKATKKRTAAAKPKSSSTQAAKSIKAEKTAKTAKPPQKSAAKPAKKGTTPKKPPKTKKASQKKLIFKQFDSQKATPSVPAARPDFRRMTAPPIIASDDPAEAERLRKLLGRKFSMTDVKAAAKTPVEKTPEPVAPAAEPAHEVAAAEAPPELSQTGSPSPSPEQSMQPETTKNAFAQTQAAASVRVPQAISTPSTESYAVPAASTTAGSADTSAATVDRIPVDSFGKQMKIAAAIFSALVFLLVWSSFSNYATYFVTTKKDSVEIMKGHFSPTGKHFFAVLHGAQFDQPEKTTYSRKEIFPILFDYYLNRSDAMLIDSSLPDFSAVGDYLQRAEQFALTSEMHQTVRQRRNNFRRLALLYKIDIDMAKASEASLQSALQHLQQAKALTTDPVQLTLIENKIDAATTTLAELKAQSEENETMLPSGE